MGPPPSEDLGAQGSPRHGTEQEWEGQLTQPVCEVGYRAILSLQLCSTQRLIATTLPGEIVF